MKKRIILLAFSALTLSVLIGCNSGTSTAAGSSITVVSREDGSGTRGAFTELMEIQEKNADGTKTDKTTTEAIVVNKTDVMLTTVAGDPHAIGYVSLGSLSNSVKALCIEGVEATAANVKNGSYPVSRPFFIATRGTPNPVAADLITFILSKQGQSIVSNGYIAVNDNAPDYLPATLSGRCVIAGSSSVSPIMEKLVEAYRLLNSGADIEIQTSDSTAGMTGTADGTCDIGMASRALKDSELATLTPTQIALDGIAVIVNPQNAVTKLTRAQVKEIFTGTATTWTAFAK